MDFGQQSGCVNYSRGENQASVAGFSVRPSVAGNRIYIGSHASNLRETMWDPASCFDLGVST